MKRGNLVDKTDGFNKVVEGIRLYGVDLADAKRKDVVFENHLAADTCLRFILRQAINRLNGGSRRLLENEITSRAPVVRED